MNTVLKQAIDESKVLELRYQGYARVVQSHAYGRDKNNDEIFWCYQTSGGSKSASTGWKLFKVQEVFTPCLTNATFKARHDYKRNHSAMIHIFAQI